MEQLYKENYFSPQQFELTQNILSTKKNFLVVGPTGSGKTTLLNSIIQSLFSQTEALLQQLEYHILGNHGHRVPILQKNL